MKAFNQDLLVAQVYCPACDQTAPADIDLSGRYARVAGGQTCRICGSSLDAALVVQVPEAA
jgi:hypothetical protein